MRQVAVAVSISAVLGCTATPVQQMQLSQDVSRQDGVLVTVRDQRPPEQRNPGQFKGGRDITRIGDRYFQPAPIAMLDHRLTYELNKQAKKADIIVTDFDVLNVYAVSGKKRNGTDDDAVQGEYRAPFEMVESPDKTDFVQCNVAGTVNGTAFSVKKATPYRIDPPVNWNWFESDEFRRSIRSATDGCINGAMAEIEKIVNSVPSATAVVTP